MSINLLNRNNLIELEEELSDLVYSLYYLAVDRELDRVSNYKIYEETIIKQFIRYLYRLGFGNYKTAEEIRKMGLVELTEMKDYLIAKIDAFYNIFD